MGLICAFYLSVPTNAGPNALWRLALILLRRSSVRERADQPNEGLAPIRKRLRFTPSTGMTPRVTLKWIRAS
jgi:hypothetical protein